MQTTVKDSYNDTLQGFAEEYTRETGKERFTVKELAVWAIRSGRWEPPHDLVIKKCCEDFSRALRDEHFTDDRGIPVRAMHVARITRGAEQLHLWADIRKASHEHIEMSFGQRRKQIVGDCRQLSRDNTFYKSIHPERPEIQIVFDFRDDVREGGFSAEYPQRNPDVME
jgi:hypothetical protein